MESAVVEQVIAFYQILFSRVFADPFRSRVADPFRRNAVVRQIGESGDAASQSLARLFLNEQLTEREVSDILGAWERLAELLPLERVANPNALPETVVDSLLPPLPCPPPVRQAGREAVYRVALHSVVQVVMLVGPVMLEWEKLAFSSTFELPRRIVNRLNQISEQIGILAESGEAQADERYELSYRDYLLRASTV